MHPISILPYDSTFEGYLRDESRRSGMADSLSFPTGTAEVAETLAEMHRHGTPVTVQGARTGIVAGAVPGGGHILSLERMKHISGLSRSGEDRFFLSVQPGVLLSEIRAGLASMEFDTTNWTDSAREALRAMREQGAHFFSPDPTEDSASIGGMIASNASGACSFRYGPTRRHVEALEIVLSDGRILNLRRGEHKAEGRRFSLPTHDGSVVAGDLPSYDLPHAKNAAGYFVQDNMDLLDLFIGMEGTLGVITAAELALLPQPAHIWGLTAFLADEPAALRLVRALRGETVEEIDNPLSFRPAAIELFSHEALDLLRDRKDAPAFANLPALPDGMLTAVYVEYHGAEEDQLAEAVMAASEAMVALGGDEDLTWMADNPHELERLKAFRHAVPEAVNLLIDERRRQAPHLSKLGTDMSVTDDDLDWVMELYRGGLSESGLEALLFGHIGDNHLHVNILPRNDEDHARGMALYLDWAAAVVRRGGSISAEHGVGKIKPAFLELMYGKAGVDQMRAVKHAFDPAGRLNPGTLFPSL